MKNTSPAVTASPSKTLAEWRRRRVKDKEMLQSKTDADLHDDQVYFTDYAMRLRARKMWNRELQHAKEAVADRMEVSPAMSLTDNSSQSQDFLSNKGRHIVLLEGAEKSAVADAAERLLGRMRGLGEASECVRELAATAGLAPKPKKAPALSGKANDNPDIERDLFTLQVRQLNAKLKDSVFGVIREQGVEADVAKTMADAFKNVHNSEKTVLMQ